MKMKTKIFDCVEMKNRIQSDRMEEYNKTKEKYDSYADFINVRSSNSEFVRDIRKKLKKNLNP